MDREERFRKLLEVYELEDLLEIAELEPLEVLLLLNEWGYLRSLEIPEPL